MKTAVSVPNDLFQLAEATARRLRISRSQLYATALAEFLEKQDAGAIKERLDALYSQETANVDPALHGAQLRSINKDRW